MADKPIAAEMMIRMDQSLTFTHTFRGSPQLLIAMIGSMDFVKDWMKEEVKRMQEPTPVHVPARAGLCENTEANSLEVEVQRDVALALYWTAMEKLRERMIAIDKSDPDATFQLDTSILERL